MKYLREIDILAINHTYFSNPNTRPDMEYLSLGKTHSIYILSAALMKASKTSTTKKQQDREAKATYNPVDTKILKGTFYCETLSL